MNGNGSRRVGSFCTELTTPADLFLGLSISSLFGRFCSGRTFSFDETVMKPMVTRLSEQEVEAETQKTDDSVEVHKNLNLAAEGAPNVSQKNTALGKTESGDDEAMNTSAGAASTRETDLRTSDVSKRAYDDYVDDEDMHHDASQEAEDSQSTERSMTTGLSTRHTVAQREAYYRMLEYMDNDEGTPIGLMSTGDNHTDTEREL